MRSRPSCASDYPVRVPDSVAVNIIVFGRGLVQQDSGYQLTRSSAERVDTLLDYVDQHKDIFIQRRGRVVFSGGWAGAGQNLEKPPENFREGVLMLKRANAASVSGNSFMRYSEGFSEVESNSTLENVLRIREAGYFTDIPFSAGNPLGLVAHEAHLDRIEYLIHKIFGLPGNAIIRIVSSGEDKTSSGIPESLILQFSRLAYVGVTDADGLRRRQRILIALNRALPQRGSIAPWSGFPS